MKQNTSINDTKVLIVDDNLLNRKLVCAILKKHEIEHNIAENGKIAFDLFLTGKYNLILMDIQMPIMNGIECTRKIREFEQKSKNKSSIPIVAITTFAMENDKRNCIEAGMNDFITKPFKTPDMIKIISKFIEIKTLS